MKATFYALLLFLSTGIYADNFVVMLAAYGESVSMGTFSDKGFNDVSVSFENAALYKYYSSKFNNEADAQAYRQRAMNAGFTFARVINKTRMLEMCNAACPKSDVISMEEALRTRNVFFDFDKSFVRDVHKRDLQLLKRILDQNPGFSVQIHAHTDGKGSNEYNIGLANRRKDAVVSYINSLGVPSSQIEEFAYGESTPIAKNELDGGQDTQQGRQLNRRVEIKVMHNGHVDSEYVEPIDVPDNLRVN